MMPEISNSEIILYQSDDERIKIQVRLENETVWLTQSNMVELFQSSKSNISEFNFPSCKQELRKVSKLLIN